MSDSRGNKLNLIHLQGLILYMLNFTQQIEMKIRI
jgi:hypothetical protein